MKFQRHPYTFVSHVHILIADLERSLAFYKETLGFQLLEQSETKAALTADGKTPLLTIEQPKDILPKQPRTTGLYHFAILLPQRSDLAKVLNHLIQANYPLQGASDHLVSEAVYLADPDGNGIEIYVDRPDETWEWNHGQVAMTTEPIADDILSEANGETWKGLPSSTVMGHIHLHVSDLDKTEEFYCAGLGFDVVNRYDHQALFISSGKYHHHIGLNTWNGVGAPAPSANSVGLKHFSLLFPDEETRNKAVKRLQEIGASVTTKDGVILTKDPSGNHIQLWI
ncbi:VOC family protein [Bacillus sp. DX1.1]|uniref:VOC family protein n=1 Tax=unclassified Bacillus (in: firmicutes) TaxID=185979 RepID=UPI00257127B4|nr:MULTISPECIES: VOC family protein [unclassified Bacillus (in: firmicutes)]MDM5154481.1 VOC family protein [Bacillus sp. DX1.1]WJE84045.1 VOC family protein [Bacillus sp. DX3.1]